MTRLDRIEQRRRELMRAFGALIDELVAAPQNEPPTLAPVDIAAARRKAREDMKRKGLRRV